MRYTRLDVKHEIEKLSRGQKLKADPFVLLRLIVDDNLIGKRR